MAQCRSVAQPVARFTFSELGFEGNDLLGISEDAGGVNVLDLSVLFPRTVAAEGSSQEQRPSRFISVAWRNARIYANLRLAHIVGLVVNRVFRFFPAAKVFHSHLSGRLLKRHYKLTNDTSASLRNRLRVLRQLVARFLHGSGLWLWKTFALPPAGSWRDFGQTLAVPKILRPMYSATWGMAEFPYMRARVA